MFKDFEKCNNIVQFNAIIQESYPHYAFYPSILKTTQTNNAWNMDLPEVKNVSGIVLHAQDNLNVAHNNIVPEIVIIEDYYAKANIGEIVLIHWNHNLGDIYNGSIKLSEFPTHSFDFVQHLANSVSKWKDVNYKTNNINFMCLSGNPRKHRVSVYNYLQKLGINSLVTLANDADLPADLLYSNYDFDNVANFIKLLPVYQSAPVNIISETLYYESKGILTEKLLQAFASLQLPILIAYKGAVSDAREFGFDMFDDIIDNSFDTMDNENRWKQAIDLNMHILHNNFDYNKLKPRLLKNQEYLLNGYAKMLLKRFNDRI